MDDNDIHNDGVRTRVLIVINTLRMGGAERFAVTMANWLAGQGVDTTMVVFEDDTSALKPAASVKTIWLHRRGSWDIPRVVLGLRRAVRATHPHAIFTTMTPATLMTALALTGMRGRPRQVARECTFHSLATTRWNRPLQRLVFRVAFRTCHTVVCLTSAMRADLRDHFGVREELMTVIPNPVDVTRCERLAQAPLAHEFLTPRAMPLIVSCARLSPPKDFPTVFHALVRLAKEGMPCRLIVLGDGELRAQLVELRNRLGLEEFVAFAGTVDNPYAYMARADVFVLSTYYEGFPNVVIEAMACGAPVVCTDCQNGLQEIITHGTDGLLVPPGDPAALASALRALLGDPRLRAAIARNGRESVTRRFHIDTIGAQYCRTLFGDPRGA